MSTFVSKFNVISQEEVRQYLGAIPGIELRERGGQCAIRDCSVMPQGICNKPTGTDQPDNQYVLNVKASGGVWFCHRCQSRGSWYDLKRAFGGVGVQSLGSGQAHPGDQSGGNVRVRPELRLPDQRAVSRFPVTLGQNPEQSPQIERIRSYLTQERGLDMSVLIKYGVGCAPFSFPDGQKYVRVLCVTFPWVMSRRDLQQQDLDLGTSSNLSAEGSEWVIRRIKARAFGRKSWQRLDPPGGGWGLFGLHTVPADAKEVVLTEGEYDAMAVYQSTGLPAVSLPNGAGSLPIDVLPLLERFDKIFLWMDNDAPGQAGCDKFARKLGLNRCYIVRPRKADLERFPNESIKDANDALRLGVDMRAMLREAQRPEHHQIVTFKQLREQVLHEIQHPNEYDGTPIKTLPQLTKVIKGVRKGELTLVTGPTGAGKTTLLSQMSLDFAAQGVNTLWGSFEVRNTRLVKKMLQQYHGKPLVDAGTNRAIEGIDAVADRFNQLPLHFMTFHGGSEVDQVLDAMDFAVYCHDVEHVIIDNLQFMLSRVGRHVSSNENKFDVQDLAIDKFRRFATDKNVHVTLVVHPRKEDEGVRLGLSSISGTAKATQEADCVLIIQFDGEIKYLDVKKNRYDGQLGLVMLNFSPHTASFYEAEPEESARLQARVQSAQNRPPFRR